jgi:hypothetical protein
MALTDDQIAAIIATIGDAPLTDLQSEAMDALNSEASIQDVAAASAEVANAATEATAQNDAINAATAAAAFIASIDSTSLDPDVIAAAIKEAATQAATQAIQDNDNTLDPATQAVVIANAVDQAIAAVTGSAGATSVNWLYYKDQFTSISIPTPTQATLMDPNSVAGATDPDIQEARDLKQQADAALVPLLDALSPAALQTVFPDLTFATPVSIDTSNPLYPFTTDPMTLAQKMSLPFPQQIEMCSTYAQGPNPMLPSIAALPDPYNDPTIYADHKSLLDMILSFIANLATLLAKIAKIIAIISAAITFIKGLIAAYNKYSKALSRYREKMDEMTSKSPTQSVKDMWNANKQSLNVGQEASAKFNTCMQTTVYEGAVNLVDKKWMGLIQQPLDFTKQALTQQGATLNSSLTGSTASLTQAMKVADAATTQTTNTAAAQAAALVPAGNPVSSIASLTAALPSVASAGALTGAAQTATSSLSNATSDIQSRLSAMPTNTTDQYSAGNSSASVADVAAFQKVMSKIPG